MLRDNRRIGGSAMPRSGHDRHGPTDHVAITSAGKGFQITPDSVSNATGFSSKRKIADILNELRLGDALIVSELSRLGRSMLECMEILSFASDARIRVYAIKGSWKLDETIQSRIISMAFSMAAEIERDLISARTKDALRARKASGLPLGRPKGPGG